MRILFTGLVSNFGTSIVPVVSSAIGEVGKTWAFPDKNIEEFHVSTAARIIPIIIRSVFKLVLMVVLLVAMCATSITIVMPNAKTLHQGAKKINFF